MRGKGGNIVKLSQTAQLTTTKLVRQNKNFKKVKKSA